MANKKVETLLPNSLELKSLDETEDWGDAFGDIKENKHNFVQECLSF